MIFLGGINYLPRSGLLEQPHEPDRVPAGPLPVMRALCLVSSRCPLNGMVLPLIKV